VSSWKRILAKILEGQSDAAIDFEDLCGLLLRLGFEERTRGSHHIFRLQGVEERLNLQSDGKHAKRYQVKQVRAVILRYGLGKEL
jgi:hypothetical protein